MITGKKFVEALKTYEDQVRAVTEWHKEQLVALALERDRRLAAISLRKRQPVKEYLESWCLKNLTPEFWVDMDNLHLDGDSVVLYERGLPAAMSIRVPLAVFAERGMLAAWKRMRKFSSENYFD
jgi:hypothetical protein